MNLVLSLGIGITLVTLADLLLLRFTPLRAQQAAMMVGLTTLAVYVPLAILRWPGMDVFTLHLALYLVTSVAFGIIGDAREARGERARFHWAPAAVIGFFMFLVAVDSTLPW